MRIFKIFLIINLILFSISSVGYFTAKPIFKIKSEILIEKEFIKGKLKTIELITFILSKQSYWNELHKEQNTGNSLYDYNEIRERFKFIIESDLKVTLESINKEREYHRHKIAVSLLIRKINEFGNSTTLKSVVENDEEIKFLRQKLDSLDSLNSNLIKFGYNSKKEIFKLRLRDIEISKEQTLNKLINLEVSNSSSNLNSSRPYISTFKEVTYPQEDFLAKKFLFYCSISISGLMLILLFKKLKN